VKKGRERAMRSQNSSSTVNRRFIFLERGCLNVLLSNGTGGSVQASPRMLAGWFTGPSPSEWSMKMFLNGIPSPLRPLFFLLHSSPFSAHLTLPPQWSGSQKRRKNKKRYSPLVPTCSSQKLEADEEEGQWSLF